jgi:Secretion system C-terminal sorting domain
MKSTINTFFLLAFLFFVKSEAFAQPLFSLEQDYFYITPNTGTLNEFDEFWTDGIFDVLPEDTASVLWRVYGQETCPEAWKIFFYDTHQCYMSPFSGEYLTSNIDSSIGLTQPMPLGGGYPVNIFNIGIYPKEVTGCCQLRVEFSLVEEPDSIIEVATYDIDMLDASCFAAASEDVPEGKVTVAPNPANQTLNISFDEPILAAYIMDLNGKIHAKSMLQAESSLDVSAMANGLYLLHIELANDKIIWKRVVVQH